MVHETKNSYTNEHFIAVIATATLQPRTHTCTLGSMIIIVMGDECFIAANFK